MRNKHRTNEPPQPIKLKVNGKRNVHLISICMFKNTLIPVTGQNHMFIQLFKLLYMYAVLMLPFHLVQQFYPNN